MEQIKVSIVCLAYNHEKYIRNALDGFVMQKTNFKFEVLIHDDASTDKTADIIREYETKYPDIIKPIYQKENQHSKGVKIGKTYQYPRAKGEYLAWCEGDDYWTDPLKLQKQYDFLSNNPEYTICVHRATVHDLKSNKRTYSPVKLDKDCDISAEQMILGSGCVTSSIMAKKDVCINRPSFFDVKGVGDYQLKMHATFCGRCRYLADVMSVYNRQTQGSWTSRVYLDNKKRIKVTNDLIDMLDRVNENYNYVYFDAIEKKKKEYRYEVLCASGDKKAIKQEYPERYKDFVKAYTKEKIKKFALSILGVFKRKK